MAPLAHGGVSGALVGWLMLQLLVLGFLARAFQLGYSRWALAILSL